MHRELQFQVGCSCHVCAENAVGDHTFEVGYILWRKVLAKEIRLLENFQSYSYVILLLKTIAPKFTKSVGFCVHMELIVEAVMPHIVAKRGHH